MKDIIAGSNVQLGNVGVNGYAGPEPFAIFEDALVQPGQVFSDAVKESVQEVMEMTTVLGPFELSEAEKAAAQAKVRLKS